jgi:DNA polymerase elongation subunit (family B)
MTIADSYVPPIPGLRALPQDDCIVAVEVGGGDGAILYRRPSGSEGVVTSRHAFQPWIVTSDASSRHARLVSDELVLAGKGELRVLKRFGSVALWSDALRELRRIDAPHLAFTARPEQFLVASGLTLFRSMRFEDLRRAQIDIETLGLDPNDPAGGIIVVTATLNGGEALAAHAGEHQEGDLIEILNEWIKLHDPDVIEGHNLFNFDVPFLAARAARLGLSLNWGRDGSPVRIGNRQRFKAGARTIPYEAAYVRGRHLVDTYQQIQRYDVAGRLQSYALKSAISELGLERPDRTHVPGEDIGHVWRTDPDRLIRYALDDVLDTNLLSELTLPTEFYQAQILPASLQSVATGGPGEKVNDLMVRAYIAADESIPMPDHPKPYPGGFTAVRATGVFGPVVNADVESLYPSIMLADGIAPASDRLGVFLPILGALTERRLDAKRTAATARGAEGALWQGIQSSLKVLINSFYGYLGYGRGYFSDFEAATRVTLRGHQVVQQVEQMLDQLGATIIEIDTDGVYFVPPRGHHEAPQVDALIDRVSEQLGDAIRLATGGLWKRMLSLRLKNYALLDADGLLTVRGSSLRSRRDEPFLRRFLHDAILGYLDPERYAPPRETYLALATRIVCGALDAESIARVETITERTFVSDANRRLARAVRGERIGERVRVYQRQDGELERIEHYADDEDRGYLLQRLRAAAERFRPIYNTDSDFDYDFPPVSPSTDIGALRKQDRMTQGSLFDF